MASHIRWWAIGVLTVALVAAVCCLIVAAVGSIPGYEWFAGLLAVVLAVSLRVLGSMWSITIGGKRNGPQRLTDHSR
jgi:hypothetical protein